MPSDRNDHQDWKSESSDQFCLPKIIDGAIAPGVIKSDSKSMPNPAHFTELHFIGGTSFRRTLMSKILLI